MKLMMDIGRHVVLCLTNHVQYTTCKIENMKQEHTPLFIHTSLYY